MYKYQSYLWSGALCFGGLFSIGALGALFSGISSGWINLISASVLGLLLLGGLVLCVWAIQTLRDLSKGIPTYQKKGKELERAQQDLHSKIDCRFSKGLSVLVLLFSGLFFLTLYIQTRGTQSMAQSEPAMGIYYARAEVCAIVKEDYHSDPQMEDVPVGEQMVEVEIQTGPYKGERFTLKNYISYFYGSLLAPGDHVTVSYSLTEGKAALVMIQDYDRTVPLIFIVLLFLGITILIGGRVGAKSLLGLGFTILCIFTILIPRLIAGASTIPTVLMICAFVTVVTFVILDGVNRKTTCAIFGTILGVCFSAFFGKFACWLLRISGLSILDIDPTIEFLLQMKQGQLMEGNPSIQLKDLLVGGILIAALGAVNDVAMSISSAMNELIKVNQNLSHKELLKSGMNIGRDMVGTMTNTLILAFVGGGLVTMIYLSSLEPTLRQFMSTAYLSVEIVQVLASSLGVIVGVPLSVILGVLLFGQPRKLHKNEKSA